MILVLWKILNAKKFELFLSREGIILKTMEWLSKRHFRVVSGVCVCARVCARAWAHVPSLYWNKSSSLKVHMKEKWEIRLLFEPI